MSLAGKMDNAVNKCRDDWFPLDTTKWKVSITMRQSYHLGNNAQDFFIYHPDGAYYKQIPCDASGMLDPHALVAGLRAMADEYEKRLLTLHSGLPSPMIERYRFEAAMDAIDIDDPNEMQELLMETKRVDDMAIRDIQLDHAITRNC
jgi:hypothetical protein